MVQVCVRHDLPLHMNYRSARMRRSSLRRGELRGLQGLLQAQHPQAAGLRVPRRPKLPDQQALPQPLPVLPPPEVSQRRHARRRYEYVRGYKYVATSTTWL